MKKRNQVVIVGGGPVGVALAVELGRRGLSCVLAERRREPQRIPKGQNLTQRSVEHFYFWGVLDALRVARILPPHYPMSGIVAYRYRPRRRRFRSIDGAGAVSLARASRGIKALPAALHLSGHSSRAERLLAILWSRRRRRKLVLPFAGAGEHHARQLRLPCFAAESRRLPVRLRFRLCGVLGLAHRGGRDLPGEPHLHRRRRSAFASALWRLWS